MNTANRTAIAQVRLTPQLRMELERMAAEQESSVSGVLRLLIARAVRANPPPLWENESGTDLASKTDPGAAF